MALRTDGIARSAQPEPVRLMAVRARHAGPEHPALQERPVLVDLAQDLPVGVVESRLEHGRHVGVEQGAAVRVRIRDRAPPRVAARTGIHLAAGTRRAAPLGDAALRVLHHPLSLAAPEPHDEAGGPGDGPRCAGRAGLRPRHVGRPGPVARFARDVDFAPGRRVLVLAPVVVLPEISRVTFRALVVPRLLAPRPVQRVRRSERLARQEVHPPLASLGLGPRVPREAERLEPAARKRNQILLQRLHAEGVRDLELARLAVGAVRPDQELPIAPREGRRHAAMSEHRVSEVAEHGLLVGGLHRQGMVRAAVRLRLLRMAARALRRPRERELGRRRRRARCRGRLASLAAGCRGEQCQRDQRGTRRGPRPRALPSDGAHAG